MTVLLLTLAFIQGASAHANQNAACESCHKYPSQFLKNTVSISSITVAPSQKFSVINWTGGVTSTIRAYAADGKGTQSNTGMETDYKDIIVTVATPTPTISPVITGFAPSSPVNDIVGATRTFNITVNQSVNVTWYFNGTQVKTNTSVTNAGYTNSSGVHGIWNVTATATNTNGVVSNVWIWNVTAAPAGAPNIMSFAPSSPVSDTAGATRILNITANRTVNVTWYINGTNVSTNIGVTEANYTNTSAVAGFWNVTAFATNDNGTDSKTWLWNVTSPPPGAPNITSWGNNKTNDQSTTLTLNNSEGIRFNATANQSITTWNWFQDDVNQNNNFDNFSTNFTGGEPGEVGRVVCRPARWQGLHGIHAYGGGGPVLEPDEEGPRVAVSDGDGHQAPCLQRGQQIQEAIGAQRPSPECLDTGGKVPLLFQDVPPAGEHPEGARPLFIRLLC